MGRGMARAVAGFEFVEHTADLGVRAWGPSLGVAFAEAARGMVEYVLDDPDAVKEHDFRMVELTEPSLDRLLLEFLDALNFLILTEGFVYRRVEVELDEGLGRLVARAHGEFHDEERHGHVHEIKAITFHDIRVQRAPPEVYVIFDI